MLFSVIVLLTLQAIITYFVAKDNIPLAFWAMILLPLIYFGLDDPKKAVAFLFLFTILDNTPMTKMYEKEFLHSLFIGGVMIGSHYIIIIIIIACWIIRSLIRGDVILKTDRIGFFVLIFMIIWIFKNFFIAVISGVSVGKFSLVNISLLFTLYFVFTREFTDEREIFYIIKAIWIGAAIMLLYGYYQLISGNMYPTVLRDVVLGGDIVIEMYFPLFTFLSYSFILGGRMSKYTALIVMLVYLIILPFTYARAALLGAGIGAFATFALYYRQRIGSLVLLIGLLALVIVFTVNYALKSNFFSPEVSSTTVERLQGISTTNIDISGAMRVAQWIEAYDVVRAHPILGLPAGQKFIVDYGPIFLKYTLDSDYLYIAVLSGLINLSVFLALLFLFFRTSYKSMVSAASSPLLKSLLLGAMGAMTGLIVTSLFQTHLQKVRTLPFFILCLAIGSLGGRKLNTDTSKVPSTTATTNN